MNSRRAEGLARKHGIYALIFLKDHDPEATKGGALSTLR